MHLRTRRPDKRPQLTPVSSMRSFWGLMAAYWFSEKWREAWGLAAMIVLLTALSAMASVWFAEASGELFSAISFLHHPQNPSTLQSLLASAGALVGIVVLREAGFIAVRHFFSTSLHRRWRAWLDERFNEALLDRNHTHFHLQQGATEAIPSAASVPDNVDQRIQESIKGMTGGAIGLAMGVAGVVLSLYFVGGKIIATSTEISGLEFLGSYASAVLTIFVVAAYVPLNTFLAIKLGAIQQKLDVRMQWAEGSYRHALATFINRGFHIAAADGEESQNRVHRRRYHNIDRTWASLNILSSAYMGFELVYDFFASRIVAYAPGLLPYAESKITLQSYITGAELANAVIRDCSWFIHVMPDIARLRANAARITELAHAIEKAQDPREFHSRTGRSELRYVRHDRRLGVVLNNIELMHPGDDEPFLSTGRLRIGPGEWALLVGESGCGKSSLLKAINGLWPHGSGTIGLPRNVRLLYAAQEVKLQPTPLKELICLPDPPESYPDAEVAMALSRAGLDDLICDLAKEGRDNQTWDQVLSGGQKQKLILARILLLRPKILLLDEPTSSLDIPSRIALYGAIRRQCADATVISVMHTVAPPKSSTGGEIFDSVLSIKDRLVTKAPVATLTGPLVSIERAKQSAEERPVD